MLTQNLMDARGRRIRYLRVSVTDRCNLRCLYCMPEGLDPKMSHDRILTYEEIARVIRAGRALGVSKIRLTGGEPLVRKGFSGFLKTMAPWEGIEDVSLTTNGVLLKSRVEKIRSAGIRRINVSLDTLDPGKFKRIAGVDAFKEVWDGIQAAHAAGMAPIKINVVPMRGINDDELEDFARLTFDYPFHVRFIEYMPMGAAPLEDGVGVMSGEIRRNLGRIGELIPIEKGKNDGPAKRYAFPGAKGEIGLISPVSRHFCHACDRLRLTASGALRPCLLSDKEVDLKGPMRSGCSGEDLERLFISAVEQKPSRHHLTEAPAEAAPCRMSAIGG
ncbi:GTP 3',8-cyclase [Candidatus Desulfarcum epimagneticum]|uniref:GTP 3',8-cyclase n=1 Tax=uncultured Desulfobacteraceae bacterium TaxID=218296 RepID=A0A484HM43_9BACT|nr:GTP 3',8-cyclase [uncultured Desulfobacteraceae bacterium]